MKRSTVLGLGLVLALGAPAVAAPAPGIPASSPQLEKVRNELLALRFKSAEGLALAAARKDADDYDTLFTLGRTLNIMGEYAEAMEAYQKCARLRPDDFRPQMMIAHIHLMLDRYDKARELCEELEGHPGFKTAPPWFRSELYTTKGGALGLKSKREGVWAMIRYGLGVRKELERAVELDPDNQRAHYALGRYFLEAPGAVGGDPVKGTRMLEKAARMDLGDFVIRGYWVRGLQKTDPDKAKDEAARFLKDFEALAESRKEFPDVK